MPLFDSLLQDLRFALRTFRKNPGFTAIAIASLALGIGSATTVFSVVNSVLLRPLPYHQPDRLMALAEPDLSSPGLDSVSYLSGRRYLERGNVLEGIAFYTDGGGGRYLENGAAEAIRGQRVSGNYFQVLGVAPLLGRTFVPEDGFPGRSGAVVLSYPLWMRMFGGNPGIVGRNLILSGTPLRVLGVMPPGFRPFHMANPGEIPQIFRPIPQAALDADNPGGGGTAVARLKPGVPVGAARAELNRIRRELAGEYAGLDPRTASITVTPLADQLTGKVSKALWLLMGAIAFLLLITCANIANLLLTRASGRATEAAVRAALGCGRWRMARQLLTESLLLAFAGGIAGVLLAWWGTKALVAWAPAEIPRAADIRVDLTVLGASFAATVISGILFGLVPALRAGRLNLHETLRAAHDPGGARQTRSLRNAFATAQIAGAFVLAVGAGLLGRSLEQLLHVDAGYDPHHILTMTIFSYDMTEAQRPIYFRQLVARARTLPGVEEAAMSSTVPLSNPDSATVYVEGGGAPGAGGAPSVDMAIASPEYFRLMRIPQLAGRGFTGGDTDQTPPVALISRACARRLFANENPLGRRIKTDRSEKWWTVVGVTGDVRQHSMDGAPDSAVYVPQAQWGNYWYRLLVRTQGDPWRIYPAVRGMIRDLNPREPMFHVQPMDDYVTKSLADRIFMLSLIGALGGLALGLAAVGIYGVISYSVAQRTREVGIRIALGANRGAVMALVLKDLARILLIGLGIGMTMVFALGRLVEHLLYGVRPADLAATSAAALVLGLVALAAAYLPCRRVMAIDPASALRRH